ncbi:MAG: virulence factor SrfB [Fluviicola sp. XM-24bin1]|nr:MAG: virulence factor SrfB [Fluviicola sp. XM-24bin1]
MSEISIIGNTGVQFFSFRCRIDKTLLRSQKLVYFEDVDLNRKRFWLEQLVLIPDEDTFVRKSEIKDALGLDQNEKLIKNFDHSSIRKYTDNQPQVFEVGNVNQVLKAFENKWIPLPFFKDNGINKDIYGPTDWVRAYIKRTDETHLDIILAIDTSLADDVDTLHTPYLHDNPHENKFQLCPNEDLILSYVGDTNCEWLEEFLRRQVKLEEGESQTKHIAFYLFLNRILKSTEKLPRIQLLSDKAGVIDVDLVLDIGNSRTCGLLFENPNNLKFNLNKVKQLELVDLSEPFKTYSESFSTRLVFKEAQFGDINPEINQNNKFQWKSFVRVGDEAEKIINYSDVDFRIKSESRSFNSSPKRYLWDSKHVEQEWNFHDANAEVPRAVYKSGISEQLKSDGSLCDDGVFGTRAAFSRRSLMTFVYLEIVAQAMRQINSYEFRTTHGDLTSKRRLKRIIISCPTAMIKTEQVALRKCAKEAVQIYESYDKVINGNMDFNVDNSSSIEIIPSVKDLEKTLDNLDTKKDWNYDEASVSQLLFLYGAIQHKFDGNPDLFFRLYGKNNFATEESQNELVIGSLDIGAGTSDLMISKYSYKYTDSTEIIPDPLYWESFNLAGDELLKNLVQEIIIEGNISAEKDKGCTGVILNHGIESGVEDIHLKINGFFGRDNANIGFKEKLMRIGFNNQIGVPIALKYMEIANKKDFKSAELTFEDLFPNEKPSQELLKYFEKHFEFKFEDIKWKLSQEKVNDIIKNTFAKLLDQIAKIMHVYKCDIIILSGRPCSFSALEEEFLRSQPTPPNRLINMNNYWIGKWYPFADDHGFIRDAKTVITVGSLISLMGGKLFKLDKFRINTKYLRSKLVSTANYLGVIENNVIKKSSMRPEDEEASLMIYDIPFEIGFKNLDSSNYPSRNLYSFQFNTKNIADQLGRSLFLDSNETMNEVENRKTKLLSKLPYKLTITRDFEKDKEKVKIEYISDKDSDDISKMNFELKLQTIDQEDGYWLDSGGFTLTIA